MSTPTVDAKEKNQEYQRDRAIERARIAALYEMKNKPDHSFRKKLFQLSDLDEGWQALMPTAAAEGLPYVRNTGGDDDFVIRLDQFIAFKAAAVQGFEPDFKDPALQQEFIDFLYEEALKTYVAKHEKIQQNKQKSSSLETTHLQLYKDMLALHQLEKDPAKAQQAKKFREEKKMSARIKDYQGAEKIRELSSRARFMQKHGIVATEEFKKQGEKYGYKNWDGVQPLPDVNLKKKSETQAVINMSDLGVNLSELYKIMNQKGSPIDYPGLPCDKGTNPFREIMFTQGEPPQEYTLMAWIEKDANGNNAFMVKPCLVSDMKAGTPKPVEINDWLNIEVKGPRDPAGMSVAEAQADAMLKLARFSFQQTMMITPPKPGVSTEGEIVLAQGEIAGVSAEATPLEPINLAPSAADSTPFETPEEVEISEQGEAVFVEKSALAQKAKLVTATPAPEQPMEDDEVLKHILRLPQERKIGEANADEVKNDGYDEVYRAFKAVYPNLKRAVFNALVMNGLERGNPYGVNQLQDKDIEKAKMGITEGSGYPSQTMIDSIKKQEYRVGTEVGTNNPLTGKEIIKAVGDKFRNAFNLEVATENAPVEISDGALHMAGELEEAKVTVPNNRVGIAPQTKPNLMNVLKDIGQVKLKKVDEAVAAQEEKKPDIMKSLQKMVDNRKGGDENTPPSNNSHKLK